MYYNLITCLTSDLHLAFVLDVSLLQGYTTNEPRYEIPLFIIGAVVLAIFTNARVLHRKSADSRIHRALARFLSGRGLDCVPHLSRAASANVPKSACAWGCGAVVVDILHFYIVRGVALPLE
jgi:uncharacterized membrane protein YjfL (UPF0719 family)